MSNVFGSGKDHYTGLLVKWYDLLIQNERKDIDYYGKLLKSRKGTVLELACGTGRLLIPFAQMGIEIEGLDVSEGMLEAAGKNLSAAGLSVPLHKGDMESFDLGKKFNSIFIAGGSFQQITDFDTAMNSLGNIFSHLNPGGMLIMDLFNPLTTEHMKKNGVWTLGRTAENEDNEKLWCYGNTNIVPEDQIMYGHYKYELYLDGSLTDTAGGQLDLRWYGFHEFKMMLEKTGFTKITAEWDYIMSSHGKSVIYTAMREDKNSVK